MRVLIAGGGIGGPCLAQGLKKAGIECVMFEREPELGRAGYRLHMNGDGGEALRQCLPDHLYELYLETSRSNPRRELAVLIDSRLNELSSRPHIGPPNLGERPHTAVNRKTLRQILLAGLGDAVRYGQEIVGYELEGERVQLQFADGSHTTGDVLVGADGIQSVVRAQRLPQLTPIDSGMRSVYGRSFLSPAQLDGLPDILRDGFIAATDSERAFVGLGLFTPRAKPVTAAARLAPGLELDAAPDYMMIAYSWIGQAPLSDSELFAADGKRLLEIMREGVRDWHPTLRDLIGGADASTCFPQALRSMPISPAWPASQVTLLGDAIHGMPPSFGAGANTALWDAGQLLMQLEAAAAGERSIPEAIGLYEAAMREHVYPILAMSTNMAANADHDEEFEAMPPEIASRFADK
jgi:salicylate hydroxylase